MKIIFLNTWNGKLKNPLIKFINQQKTETDIFCFQEVEKIFFKNLKDILSEFKGLRVSKDYVNEWTFNSATFIKKGININPKYEVSGSKLIGEYLNIKIKIDKNEILICNVHGISLPGDKLDTKERLIQSKEIIESTAKYKIPTIIGGDFNLEKNTKSIKLFRKNGYLDLINDFKIKKTRNKIAWEFHKNSEFGFFGKQKYSDYCFVSRDVVIKSFEVPDLAISDHLPLILEFNL